MRRVKLIGVAILAVVALSAVVSASASAAAPEFKPAEGKITATSGLSILQIKGGNAIFECEKDILTITITGAKTTTFDWDFYGCKVDGIFEGNSPGDAAGTILIDGTDTLCKISGTRIGDALAITPVTVEVAGKHSEVEGTVIGEVTPTGKKTLTGELILEQSGGAQKITKCEGETGTLIILANEETGGTKKEAGEATTDKLEDEKETEVTN
jgi:hypothetical protein